MLKLLFLTSVSMLQCHQEKSDHELMKLFEIVFACKKCKKVFRKDVRDFEESDEYCPHCDNHFVIPQKTRATEGQLMIQIEGDSSMMRGSLN
jgi:Zn finger protein HypA/HybF involved in hydrogenase expression